MDCKRFQKTFWKSCSEVSILTCLFKFSPFSINILTANGKPEGKLAAMHANRSTLQKRDFDFIREINHLQAGIPSGLDSTTAKPPLARRSRKQPYPQRATPTPTPTSLPLSLLLDSGAVPYFLFSLPSGPGPSQPVPDLDERARESSPTGNLNTLPDHDFDDDWEDEPRAGRRASRAMSSRRMR